MEPITQLVQVSGTGTEPLSIAAAKLWLRIEGDQNIENDLIGSLCTAARQWAEQFCRRSFLAGDVWRLTLNHFPQPSFRNGAYFDDPLSEFWGAGASYPAAPASGGSSSGSGDSGSNGGSILVIGQDSSGQWLPGASGGTTAPAAGTTTTTGVLVPSSPYVSEAQAVRIPMGPVSAIDSVKYYDASGTQQTLDPSLYLLMQDDNANPRLYPAYGTGWPWTEFRPDAVAIEFTAGGSVPAPAVLAMQQLVAHWYLNREAAVITSSTAQQVPFLATTLLWPYRQYEF